jgi:two-component sensor histidine kinase
MFGTVLSVSAFIFTLNHELDVSEKSHNLRINLISHSSDYLLNKTVKDLSFLLKSNTTHLENSDYSFLLSKGYGYENICIIKDESVSFQTNKHSHCKLDLKFDNKESLVSIDMDKLIISFKGTTIVQVHLAKAFFFDSLTEILSRKLINEYDICITKDISKLHASQFCSNTGKISKKLYSGNHAEIKTIGSYLTGKWKLHITTLENKYSGNVLLYPSIVFCGILLLTAMSCYMIFKKYYQNLIIQRQQKELQHANKELKTKVKDLEYFSYIVAHDLQSPIRNIISLSHLIEEEVKEHKNTLLKEDVQTVINQSHKMLSFIKDVLRLCLSENKDTESQKIDLNLILSDEVKTFKNENKNTIVKLESNLEVASFIADKLMITTIFRNLISNAIKYKKPSEPFVNIEITNQLKDDSTIEFSIKDYGLGIDEEVLEKITKPFQRGHYEQNGSGIGLTIVTKFVEKQGGYLWIKSVKNQYTEIFFTIKYN